MVKWTQSQIGLKSIAYLGLPMEDKNLDFEVLAITNLKSTCLIGVLNKIELNDLND